MGGRFTYPTASGWKEWQKEYRFGALYIFPPSPIIEAVDSLRQQYDPRSAASAQAHLSLSEPLLGPLTDPQLHELTAALALIKPFSLHYGPLRSFPPYPGVTYAIHPEDTFMQLRAAIHSSSIFATSPLSRRDIAPHMTIAEFISLDESDRLLHELDGVVPEGDFLVDAVEYAVPDERLYFHRVFSMPLAQ